MNLVWNDNTPDSRGHVWVSQTTNAGASWTHPRPVANLPCQTLLPSIAVNPRGAIGVGYYAYRQCAPGTAPLADAWFASSTDRAAPWRTLRLAGPFDMRSAVNLPANAATGQLPGAFLGDYTGLTPLKDGFGAILILPKPYAPVGQQGVFFRRISTR
ncbi:MAG: hypothetical protein E6G56_14695 [Actinobacteria bacterium]|nr:MAG: hypothetical protein E6G56_14695 [Actinomycetota bacterium]